MSGIAGILHFDGQPVEPGLIEKMTGAMAHRGPDAINHWVKGSVALGQCMLRTTPESLEEHQPLTHADDGLVLVFDGRLDNRDQLIRELRVHRIELESNSDAALLLGAYRLWGEDSPKYLLGDFAYAVWDARCRTLLVLEPIADGYDVLPSHPSIRLWADSEAALIQPGLDYRGRESELAASDNPFALAVEARTWRRGRRRAIRRGGWRASWR